jgi:epoxyqueuosine reductase QueG
MAEKRDTTPDAGGNVKEDLRAFALKSGATVMGVADAEAFAAAPDGKRPTDYLPGAKSVVVMGGAQPRAADWQSPKYEHMEVSSTTDRIAALGNRVATHIERTYGYYALNVPQAVDKGRQPFLSMSLAAELAGCGSPSLAGPVLHAEHGFMYYSAVITTLPMAPDAQPETPVCPAPQCVEMWDEHGTTPCIAVCPIDDGGCIGGTLKDGAIASRRFDQARCTTRVQTYWVPGFQKTMEALFDEEDREKRRMILNSTLMTRTLWSMTYANISQGQCFECMRVCPVGAEKRRLR